MAEFKLSYESQLVCPEDQLAPTSPIPIRILTIHWIILTCSCNQGRLPPLLPLRSP